MKGFLKGLEERANKVATPNLILDCPQSRTKNQEQESDEEEEEKILECREGIVRVSVACVECEGL